MLSPNEFALVRAVPAQWIYLKQVCEAEYNVRPNPFTAFSTEETYNTENHESTSAASIMDAQGRLVYRAAMCYQITGDTRYATHAQVILDAWAKTLKRIDGVAAQGQLGFYMPYFITGASWVYGANGWKGELFKRFLEDVVLPASRSYYTNNVATWGLAMDVAAGSFLNDRAILDASAQRWEDMTLAQIGQIKDPLNSSVTLPDYYFKEEICRSDTNLYCNHPTRKGISGIGYSHFTMHANVVITETLKKEGIDVYTSPAGTLINQAFTKIVTMTNAPTTSPYNAFLVANCTGDCGYKSTRNAAYFAPWVKRFPSAGATAELTAGVSGSPWFWELLYNQKWVTISGIGSGYSES